MYSDISDSSSDAGSVSSRDSDGKENFAALKESISDSSSDSDTSELNPIRGSNRSVVSTTGDPLGIFDENDHTNQTEELNIIDLHRVGSESTSGSPDKKRKRSYSLSDTIFSPKRLAEDLPPRPPVISTGLAVASCHAAVSSPALHSKNSTANTTELNGEFLSIRKRSGSADLTNLRETLKQNGESSEGVTSTVVRAGLISNSAVSGGELRTKLIHRQTRSSDDNEESPQRWRDRLWPARALTAFCRALTRCEPPSVTPGQRISASRKHDGAHSSLVLLSPHWSPSQLKPIGEKFHDIAAHNAAFFLPLIEESRESAQRELLISEDNNSHLRSSNGRVSTIRAYTT
jgi:hypothetical protein